MGIFRMGYTGIGSPVTILIFMFGINILGCGGGAGNENNTVGGKGAVTVTSSGIQFWDNGYYTADELTDASKTVDEYYKLVSDCAISQYPALKSVILSLPLTELTIIVVNPDKYNPAKGQEAFSCQFSEKGCAGIFDLGGVVIEVPPSLDALGFEIGHWMNYMLFGTASDNNPNDLSRLCNVPSICHLYSQSRNLLACRK